MPRRAIRCEPGEFYHVYNRGANRGPIFFQPDHYLFFLRRLRQKLVGEKYNAEDSKSVGPAAEVSDTSPHVTVVAYCLMPNHYHLLLRVESNHFSERMQAFGTSYSKAINKQIGRSGTLFEGRFQAKHVDQESYLLHLSRYIHLNPVAARLVRQPAEWEFSSYREYLAIRAGTLPCPQIVLGEFSSREHYRRFVESKPSETAASIDHLLFEE
ncbi:MAG TPA: transposase [Pirellulaceae bacterium]|nr:transposase [Pirellulaceae bacterium]